MDRNDQRSDYDFGKDPEISNINSYVSPKSQQINPKNFAIFQAGGYPDQNNSLENIFMLDLDPVKSKRMKEIDQKINDIFGAHSTRRDREPPSLGGGGHNEPHEYPNSRNNSKKNSNLSKLKFFVLGRYNQNQASNNPSNNDPRYGSGQRYGKSHNSPHKLTSGKLADFDFLDKSEDDFGKALESLNTSFKIPKLQMVEASDPAKFGDIDHKVRKELAKSLSSHQTNTLTSHI